MCLLLKATDAKPKHSFSRLQRLLQHPPQSAFSCLHKTAVSSYFNAYKAIFLLPLSTISILSRILLPLLLLCFW